MPRTAPLPPALLDRAQRQEGLLSTQQCDAAGVGADRRASLRRAGVLVPVVRGVHAVARAVGQEAHAPWRPTRGAPTGDVAGDTARRRRRRAVWLALLTVGTDRAVATGWCALALHGVEGLPAGLPPEAASTGAGTHRFRGDVRRRILDAGTPLLWRDGVRAVDPVTALAQALPQLSRAHAVAVLDSALQRHLLREDGLAAVRRALRGRRGASRVESSWWDLVDGRAQSPLETWARLQCRDAGVPPHDLQVPVRDAAGRVVARGDLGWLLRDGRLLVVEIDGAAPHSTPDALFRDRERQNSIVATGALVLRSTAGDVHAGRVAAAVAVHLTAGTSRDAGRGRARPARPPGPAP